MNILDKQIYNQNKNMEELMKTNKDSNINDFIDNLTIIKIKDQVIK